MEISRVVKPTVITNKNTRPGECGGTSRIRLSLVACPASSSGTSWLFHYYFILRVSHPANFLRDFSSELILSSTGRRNR